MDPTSIPRHMEKNDHSTNSQTKQRQTHTGKLQTNSPNQLSRQNPGENHQQTIKMVSRIQ